jgi:Rrf2 family protein
MQLTTRSRYGLRMLLDIAINGGNGPVRIQDIAERRKISVKYLEQLIRELKKGGFIHSKRGPKGGHVLARTPAEIKIGDVVRILEGRPALTECVSDEKVCPISSDCVARRIWERATQSVFRELDSITLADMLDQVRQSEMTGFPCC